MSDGTILLSQRTTKPAGTTGMNTMWTDTSGNIHMVTPDGNNNAFQNNYVAQVRLSLSSACAVPTTDITGATAVYLLPYSGNQLALYSTSASAWSTYTLTSASIAPPNSASTVFDVFAYANGSSVALETANWSGSWVRATELSTQSGIYVKTGDATRRYLGTCRTGGTAGQTQDTNATRFVWNYYNRVDRQLLVSEYSNHTYNGVWRRWNNTTVATLWYIIGVLEEKPIAGFDSLIKTADGSNAIVQIYTNGNANQIQGRIFRNHNAQYVGASLIMLFDLYSVLGYNYAEIWEYSDSASSTFTNVEFQIRIRC